MFLLSHSFKNIWRYKSRYIISGFFLLFASMACGYSTLISNASIAAKKAVMADTLQSRYIFNYPRGSLASDGSFIEGFSFMSLPREVMLDYCDSSYIEKTTLSLGVPVVSSQLTRIGPASTDPIVFSFYPDEVLVLNGFDFGSTNDIDKLNEIDEFRFGLSSLKEGRLFEKDGEVVISEMLARQNGLSIGSVIPYHAYFETDDIWHSLTVVGIYETKNIFYNTRKSELYAVRENMPFLSFDVRGISSNTFNNHIENIMYTTFDTAYNATILEDADASHYLKGQTSFYPIFYIKDDSTIENPHVHSNANKNNTMEELYAKGLPQDVYLEIDRKLEHNITAELDNFSRSMFFSSILFTLIGSVILFFTVALMMRERKYEFGVLLSMGMSNAGIFGSALIEMVAFVFSVWTIGVILVRIFAEQILGMFYHAVLSWYDIHLGFTSDFITTYYTYGIVLTFLPLVFVFVYIVKLSPLKLFNSH